MPTTYDELLRAYEGRGRKLALITNYLHMVRRDLNNADPACIVEDLLVIVEEDD